MHACAMSHYKSFAFTNGYGALALFIEAGVNLLKDRLQRSFGLRTKKELTLHLHNIARI